MDERLCVVVVYDDTELLDVACVTSSLHAANAFRARPPYRIRLASPGAGAVACSAGLALGGQESLERLIGPIDTLVVVGGEGHERAAGDARLVGHVRRLARVSRRVASVCTGATVLAAAGLLDGRAATTHWAYADRLADRHPAIKVDSSRIYLNDGNVYTAAGVTSALDLTLALIEDDHGADLARWVARGLVTYLQRPGNQAQMSVFTSAPPSEHPIMRRLVDHVAGHLDADLGTAALAALAGVSERQLNRLFATQLGRTPGRYVRQVRLEAAAHLLGSTSLPVAAIARRCGFGSAETLRQAFVAAYSISPTRYRARWRRASPQIRGQ